jgi:DNA modification methylase
MKCVNDNIDFKKLSKEQLLELVKTITETTPTTILRENKPQRSELHPTMKPVKLIGKLINNSSRINEIVADGFLGSGTTMVAAHQLNRRCYGLELEPRYCEVIIQRMRKLDPGIVIKKNGEVMQFTVN